MALFKELCDVFSYSSEEIPGIDSSIMVHEIKNYLGAKHVHQKLQHVYSRKTTTIKEEVEELSKVGFIYPMPLTKWVSNIVLLMKKQGTICICVYYWDLNRAYPKENYLDTFIDQIIDNCSIGAIFSFMDGCCVYNKINILPSNQHKTTYIFPWGTFAYHKIPFGLKNARFTFPWAMSCGFHDIKNIVDPYLNYLPPHSYLWEDHIRHL